MGVEVLVAEETVAVIGGAAPLGLADVVVGDDVDVEGIEGVDDGHVGLRVGHGEESGVVLLDAGYGVGEAQRVEGLLDGLVGVAGEHVGGPRETHAVEPQLGELGHNVL